MALKLERFFESPDWRTHKGGATNKVELDSKRTVAVVMHPCAPTRIFFRFYNNTINKVEYVNGEWVGDTPLWPELYDIPVLIKNKLRPDAWVPGTDHCHQLFTIGSEAIYITLSFDGLLIKYKGRVYTLHDSLPKEVIQWLLT